MSATDVDAGGGASPTVLVVDDAPTVRAYASGVLRAAGFTVEEACNGLEAMELLVARTVDLVVTDVNMPQMDGYELVRHLRERALEPAVPVVVMTTEARDADNEAALASGANFHLSKPAAPEVLVRIAQVLTARVAGPVSSPVSSPVSVGSAS
ncbi:two-component system, chemotaxis family, response regulator CheY [Quadrisphaera granulorum]|uniref:Two-component system chemotaxis response regulator CheY n=1 Tax=Quadrisphaera granulorum TaxID=317664 RepID=A0A316AD35_9ACTN|nr:response regulator [Quadrisphaera granulorum]PWJ55696.1 two-component system chemotaxis response regulator CheY [Quadrisphaera granulorum]SZE95193.1 two-component system, chemotaxis family, response regulator CheY [Quadrisphaera granulorum]